MSEEKNKPAAPWSQVSPPIKQKSYKTALMMAAVTLVFLGIAYWVATYRGFRWGLPLRLNARYASDGFFVVGLILTCLGLLVWVSTTGFFDIFSYGFRSLLVMFTPLVKPESFPKFYDYKTKRAENRKPANFKILFLGVAFIVLSALALLVYYS